MTQPPPSRKPDVENELEAVTHEQYTGRSSDELNREYGLDGWPCAHQPPHGIRLKREGKFVVTRHFPDEKVTIAISPFGKTPDGRAISR